MEELLVISEDNYRSYVMKRERERERESQASIFTEVLSRQLKTNETVSCRTSQIER